MISPFVDLREGVLDGPPRQRTSGRCPWQASRVGQSHRLGRPQGASRGRQVASTTTLGGDRRDGIHFVRAFANAMKPLHCPGGLKERPRRGPPCQATEALESTRRTTSLSPAYRGGFPSGDSAIPGKSGNRIFRGMSISERTSRRSPRTAAAGTFPTVRGATAIARAAIHVPAERIRSSSRASAFQASGSTQNCLGRVHSAISPRPDTPRSPCAEAKRSAGSFERVRGALDRRLHVLVRDGLTARRTRGRRSFRQHLGR